MIFYRSHFHFLKNREIDALYLTIALLLFGEGLISIFVPIYFWELGMPLWRIIYFYFLISLSFVFATFLLLPIVRKLSDKMMMFLSLPFVIAYFLGLGSIRDYPFLFYVLPAVLAVNLLLFNVGYHLSFSGAADKEYIGREVGARHLTSDLVTLSAPFLGGVSIAVYGFKDTFLFASIILFLAILPLFFFPKRQVAPNIKRRDIIRFLEDKRLLPFTLSGIGFANEKMIAFIVWPLFLFLKVGDITKFGGILSFGLLASAIITFIVGFLSDQGMRRRTLKYATVLCSGIWILRHFLGTAFAFAGSHVGGHIANSAVMVTWSSQYYKIAQALPATSAFILSREVLYHISRSIFLPALMGLAYILPHAQFFAASFLIAAFFMMLFLYSNKVHNLY